MAARDREEDTNPPPPVRSQGKGESQRLPTARQQMKPVKPAQRRRRAGDPEDASLSDWHRQVQESVQESINQQQNPSVLQ